MLPREVTDRIFEFCEPAFNKYCFSPNSRLHPLLLVCKEWYPIAERRLYSSVSLGDEEEFDGVSGWACSTKLEARILGLASLVRELRLGTGDHARTDTKQHAALIKICKNVQHIQISGYNGYVLDELKAALATTDLVSLSVSHYGLRDWEGDSICCHAELLNFMLNWPRLKKIEMADSMMEDKRSDGQPYPEPSEVTG